MAKNEEKKCFSKVYHSVLRDVLPCPSRSAAVSFEKCRHFPKDTVVQFPKTLFCFFAIFDVSEP